ncbi:C5a anaphylatoxin chemotactic receptor 2 [Erinaceus europaeus]|uniref:C5a anaphylatoxin chemotactic receptor 2 n=1 Tax=Erinaceus europaeus TaxID=9365 RepID=A0ABM3W8E7_ERIEU|nr:C5a anaphylatoxin chemotactic receptor 2 [Erinaceus europaeus]XP_060032863.1 C5a anaphylatoxin chemotactic receptor 2 [Erinaceus europaeus]XP_060032871.1 C5a anaphylatoxin chemotactic receptor 2 [Erinaceus europaeus]XP_060032879.1 C5a anaphylatoxin chemotactic receptor 2 [Erinaceus europaeus]XP_060032887.1 C5a anaphylatoxin chemotactic receptor 2 [Erinaceus europaeus]XP_060032892.1 C5a anaphylatoxin chemotactic receptor 2 [Erinaceus europaeus]
MENASLSPDYSHYDDDELGDLPVDCAGGACGLSSGPGAAPLLLHAAAFLLGAPGNALAAWAARGAARRGARGAAWLLHLAAADLLCCLALPLLTAPLAPRGQWPFGEAGCRALPALGLLALYAAGLLLAALSAHQGLRACRARGCGPRGARGAAWALALLLSAPSLLTRRLHRERFPERLLCVVDYGGSSSAERALAAARFALGFLAPLLLAAGGQAALQLRASRRRWPLGTAALVGCFLCCAPFHGLGLLLAVAAPRSALLARALQAEPLALGLALARSCLSPGLLLYFGRARLRESPLAACSWALREPESLENSEHGHGSSRQDLVTVSEAEM